MKELSIEEKAKRYDESLERAKKLKETCDSTAVVGWCEYIFNELRESEDEKIRKEIVRFIQMEVEDEIVGNKWLAWLEKQNKENMIEALRMEYEKGKVDVLQEQRKEWTAEDLLNRNEIIDILQEYNRDDLITWFEKQGKSKFESCVQDGDNIVTNEDGTHFNVSQLERVSQKATDTKEAAKKFLKTAGIMDKNGELSDEYRLEKQGEQKPTDKIESHFHVEKGKWYMCIKNNVGMTKGNVYYGISDGYIIDDGGKKYNCNNWAVFQKYLRLWTIQDAKDGDVLVTVYDKRPFIYKGCLDPNHPDSPVAYCGIDTGGYFCKGEDKFNHWWTDDKVQPATKEQRDALMKSMTDAGYTFDFESKELKEIVVPIFNIGDTIIKKRNSDINDFGQFTITDITGGKYWYNDRIICDITEQDKWEIYESVKQNPAWSEEDERMYNASIRAYQYMIEHFENSTKPYEDAIDWLKSLKERMKGENSTK